jgi:hypothetical protein
LPGDVREGLRQWRMRTAILIVALLAMLEVNGGALLCHAQPREHEWES